MRTSRTNWVGAELPCRGQEAPQRALTKVSRALERLSSSDVPHPRPRMLRLLRRVPTAREVEQRDDNREHEIEQRETPLVSGGRRTWSERMVAEQPRIHVAFANERHD